MPFIEHYLLAVFCFKIITIMGFNRVIFLSSIICNTVVGFSQTTVPVDIVTLSEQTFYKNPDIQRNNLTITTAKGQLQIQKSTFDYQLTSEVSLGRSALNPLDEDPISPYVVNSLNSKTTTGSIALQRTFRSSLSASLNIGYDLSKSNLPFNRFNQESIPYLGDHTVSSTFSLKQPLLRGRGKTITTALEQASKLNLDGVNNSVEFANSYELLQTGVAYWQYVLAYKRVFVFKENEARVKRVLEVTQDLVKGDKKPIGDLVQIQADLANQERQTKVSEQVLFSAKLNLGRRVGLSEKDAKLLGNPLDEFPTIAESGYTSNIDHAAFLAIAQQHRKDIIASTNVQDALDLQLNFANNNKKPQLDLTAYVNYGGMNLGNGVSEALATFTQNTGRQLGGGIGLRFSLPVNNNQAQGTYLQRKVALKDQQIVNTNLHRNVNLNVSIALNNLENSVLVLEKALESLKFYQEVYNNEQIKFQNGLTTLLNVILFQERLTISQLDYLQAHQQFAIAIINLRYETGTLLLNTTNNTVNINKTLFYTIPENNAL